MVSDELLKIQDVQIDELLDQLKEKGHKLLRQAYASGAINSENYNDPESYMLAKIIITLLENAHYYYPMSKESKKDFKNLEKFI